MRFLIVDDHKLFGEAFRALLEDQGMDVLGVAATGGEAMRIVQEERPDVVLLDIGLPDENGIEVGRRILEQFPETKVVALTGLDDHQAARSAVRAGFHAFLTKDSSAAQFVNSLRTALNGQVVVAQRLAKAAAGAPSPAEEHAALLAKQLTRRELEVLSLLAEGAGSSVIASRLSLSPNTVRTHIQNILTKLQVHSRLEAAAFAVRHRLVKVSDGRAGDT